MRTTVRLPEDLMRRAKIKARAENRSLTDLIAQGVRSLVDDVGRENRPVVIPPISQATGGLHAGVDLAKTSELLETLDMDLPIEQRR